MIWGRHDRSGRGSRLADVRSDLDSDRGDGAVLLAAVVLTDFSIEPVAFGVTSGIALALALVA
jgi:hypothetical protein